MTDRVQRIWLMVIMLLLMAAKGHAADATIDSVRFRNFGISSGLSQTTVRALLQDEQGFLWIGTQDGLNRFDGYDFKVYAHDRRDASSLGDNHITAMTQGDGGVIWIGTVSGGLNRLDPRDEQITVYRHRLDQAGSLAADGVVALLRSRDGRLLVATAAGGLQTLLPTETEFAEFGPAATQIGVIRSMVQMADGSIWLGGNQGLWRYQAEHDRWTPVAADIHGLGDIQALSSGADGSIWAGTTRSGLWQLSADGQVQTEYHSDATRSDALPDDQVRALLHTRSGQLWVGTMNGLALHQQTTDRFLNWRYDASDAGSPAGNRIASLYEDRDGLIWIGTWTGGFSIHNPATQVVRLIRNHGRDQTSLPASPVRALWMDHDGSLWMGILEGGGLIHYDIERGVLQRWVHDPLDPASLAGDVVQSIARTPDGRLWVGTQGAGISRMRADGQGFDHFKRGDQPGDLRDNVIQVLYIDHQGDLWVGCETGGLAHWRGDERGFEVFQQDASDPNSLQANSIYSMAETQDGSFWIGTFGAGLARFDRDSGHFQHFRVEPGNLDSISHNSVTVVLESHDGTMWVGTQGGGINRVDRLKNGALKFSAIGKREGLGSEAIGTLVEDRNGILWIGTTVGVNSYDPATREVRSFSASEGMDKSGYFIGSVARGADGSIYLGGLRGVLAFHPRRLPQRGREPHVVLTELRLNNGPVRLRNVDPDSPLTGVIYSMNELNLPPGLSSVSLDYSALDFANPDGLRYAYRMDGMDDEWISTAGLSRTAAYTNLGAGSYLLRVRAKDGEGGDYGPETRLRLNVAPPAWRSHRAIALYIGVLALLLALIWRATRQRWEREHRAAEAIRHSEERLKLALWGSRDELWDLDLRTGKMERENILPIISPSAQVQFSSRDHFLQQVHPDDQPDVLNALNQHVQGESEFYENTFRMRTLDGGWCWVLSRGFAVERDAQGRALRMVGTSRDVSASAESAEALRRLNDELEQRVEERTRALRLSNRELQFTLGELKNMQKQLVESEKMAALGGLVAGIAHEINTPLGIGVTAASHLEDATRELMRVIADGQISRAALTTYQNDALSSAQLILSNLRRAGQLIKSFKQVAVDQSSEQAREIDLKTYLGEVLISLGPALKKTAHKVSVSCPEQLLVRTYPGAVSQIVVNLIMNSLIHGFEGIEQGEIRIECQSYDEEWLLLYRDNGRGMSEEVRLRVFDPFFTTKRGQGGSGLGLHVVYNLVTQLLHGSLDCISSPGQGVEFQIQMPKRVI